MESPPIRFVTIPKLTAAVAPHRGSYSTIGRTMQELCERLAGSSVRRSGELFCLFYDNPSETPEAELRSDACVPVTGALSEGGPVAARSFPEVLAAETRHLGRPEDFGMTYGPFLEGLLRSGYDLVGPAREYYRSVQDIRGPGSGYLIRQPVAKKRSA